MSPTLKMKRALVRRTSIPLRRFRASCEVETNWHTSPAGLYAWEDADMLGGKAWVGRAYRVTLELWGVPVSGSKWCGAEVDPLIPDTPQLRAVGANRCNLPAHRDGGHVWTMARQVVGNGRPRGRMFWTSTGEGTTVRAAVEMSLVIWDRDNGSPAVRLDPTPQAVASIVYAPMGSRSRSHSF